MRKDVQPEELMETLLLSPEFLKGFDAEGFLSDLGNICLTDGKGSFALFEARGRKVFEGHQFFKVRGKEAVAFGLECLEEVFKTAEVVVGLTPDISPRGKVMARRLGFTSYGHVITAHGRCEIFVLTREEFK